jgi:hypothetical protein
MRILQAEVFFTVASYKAKPPPFEIPFTEYCKALDANGGISVAKRRAHT